MDPKRIKIVVGDPIQDNAGFTTPSKTPPARMHALVNQQRHGSSGRFNQIFSFSRT